MTRPRDRAGVGMAVVKPTIEQLYGVMTLETEPAPGPLPVSCRDAGVADALSYES